MAKLPDPILGGTVTFSFPCHDPTANAQESDADALPTYRVYEELTNVPILNGNCQLLDDANTVGFYGGQFVASAANGFEVDKFYGILCRAIVNTIPGQAVFHFKVLNPLGPGATAVTYTLTNANNGQPIADADIWVTTDAAGTNTVATGTTDSLGQVTFYLDSGVTYYVWRQKDGWNFDNPDVEIVP
jgi:hypothetical protein